MNFDKSLNYLKSKHINIFTLNLDYLPSYLGCRTSHHSPSSFDKEESLLSALKKAKTNKQSSLLFSGTHSLFKHDDLSELLEEANKIAVQKVSSSNRYRYINKVGHSFVHSFIHSFIRSFVRSFINSLTHSLI